MGSHACSNGHCSPQEARASLLLSRQCQRAAPAPAIAHAPSPLPCRRPTRPQAPAQPKTAHGEMLAYYLKMEPQLFKAAIDEQFQRLSAGAASPHASMGEHCATPGGSHAKPHTFARWARRPPARRPA